MTMQLLQKEENEEFEGSFDDGTDVNTHDSFNYFDDKSSKFDEENIQELNFDDVKVHEGCLQH